MALITEPVRKSILDVVQHNLRAAGLETYVTRVVYLGRYYGSQEVLREKMENIIQELRMDYSEMPITGLLLVYPTCYIHVLEAWEDIIYKHYELMYTKQDNEYKFGRAIHLPWYHHVYQRYFTEWCHVYMTPPTLLATLENDGLTGIKKHTWNCLMKVYTLCEYISNTMQEKLISAQNVLYQLDIPKAGQYLPDVALLEFLLDVKSPVIKTVEECMLMYSDLTLNLFWEDSIVWPPPCDIMPRDVFDEYGHRKVSADEKTKAEHQHEIERK